eukprot:TRINITY_DN6013_c0_g1_i7.p1 TRINITY_DN6013_c0_g1~~TRINITY_DN6013_c0_g1_i7.p1  ORF type:complete len:189 (+),score=45.33 TRINITY_DN6013_c0_g1_i7:38-604(+)
MELNLDDSFLYEGFSEFSNDNKENLVMNDRKSGRWTKSEHMKFLEGLKTYGKNWKKVEDFVGSRSGAQIRSHAQKFFNRLEKEYHITGYKKDSKSNLSLKIRKKQEEILSGYKSSSKDSFYVHLMKSLSTEVEDPFKCELRLSNLVEWKFRNPKTEFFTLVSSTPHTVQHRTSSCAQEPPASKKVKEF